MKLKVELIRCNKVSVQRAFFLSCCSVAPSGPTIWTSTYGRDTSTV